MEPSDELLDGSTESAEEINPEEAETVTGGGSSYGTNLSYGN